MNVQETYPNHDEYSTLNPESRRRYIAAYLRWVGRSEKWEAEVEDACIRTFTCLADHNVREISQPWLEYIADATAWMNIREYFLSLP
jgi:hypothetical protein